MRSTLLRKQEKAKTESRATRGCAAGFHVPPDDPFSPFRGLSHPPVIPPLGLRHSLQSKKGPRRAVNPSCQPHSCPSLNMPQSSVFPRLSPHKRDHKGHFLQQPRRREKIIIHAIKGNFIQKCTLRLRCKVPLAGATIFLNNRSHNWLLVGTTNCACNHLPVQLSINQ